MPLSAAGVDVGSFSCENVGAFAILYHAVTGHESFLYLLRIEQIIK